MPISKNFSAHFASLTDPRKNNHNKHHKLGDILILTILAVICGAESWVESVIFRVVDSQLSIRR